MTVLAASVAIGDNSLRIDAALADGSWPAFVKIDSELLNVGGADNRLGTTLVLSAPATATHTNGSTVTYAGRPYSAAFLSATGGAGAALTVDNGSEQAEVSTLVATGADLSTPGTASLPSLGEQRVRLLGPFRVQYNTSGMTPNGAGAIIGDALPVGAWVWAWPAVIVGFNNAGTDSLLRVDLWWEHAGGVGVPGTLGEILSAVGTSGAFGEDSSSSGYPIQSAAFTGTGRFPPQPYRIISENVKLVLKLTGTDPGTPTTGTADIYCRIEESV